MTFHYRVYGEPLASEIEISFLEPCEPSGGGWSFRAGAESVPSDVDWYHAIACDDEDGMVRYGRTGESHFVQAGNLATVRISTAEKQIVVCAPVAVSRETMSHVVVDQVLPLCIAHSRRIVLHASCVARGDSSIAFAGPSGSGKSTLAATFCRRGWQLVSDDALAFASVSPPRVNVAYRSVRLWGDSLRWMGERDLSRPRVTERMEKWRLEMPSTAETRLLRRIYLLKPAESARGHRIRNPSLSETMLGLAASTFRLDTRDRGYLEFEFDALFGLSRACPTSLLEVARGFDRIASLIDIIDADLATR